MEYKIDWDTLPVDRGEFEFAADGLTRGERIAYAKMLTYSGRTLVHDEVESGIPDSFRAQRAIAIDLDIQFPMFRRVLKKMFVLREDWQWRAPITTKVTQREEATP